MKTTFITLLFIGVCQASAERVVSGKDGNNFLVSPISEIHAFQNCVVAVRSWKDGLPEKRQETTLQLISGRSRPVIYEARSNNYAIRIIHNQGSKIFDVEKYALTPWPGYVSPPSSIAIVDARIDASGKLEPQRMSLDPESYYLKNLNSDYELLERMRDSDSGIIFSRGTVGNFRVEVTCDPQI